MHLLKLIFISTILFVYTDKFPNDKTEPERLIHFQKALDGLTGVKPINIERKTAFEHFRKLMENKRETQSKQTTQEEKRDDYREKKTSSVTR